MTKIIEKNKQKDVHLHIDKAYAIIGEHCPMNYTEKVMEKMSDPSLTSAIIRNLKHRVTRYPISRIPVLNALVEISLQHKADKEKLSRLTSQSA